jgi:hypothetical protein
MALFVKNVFSSKLWKQKTTLSDGFLYNSAPCYLPLEEYYRRYWA